MLKIGRLSLTSRLILAPMAGITDLPFRMISRSFDCELAFAEMISARSLVYKSKKTMRMISTAAGDRPLGVQLLGNDPLIMSTAMEVLEDHDFDIIDLNAACPVTKVTCRGEGAALLKEPRRLHGLLRTMVERSDVPVTLKIRAGWDDACLNARDIALRAEDSGIAAVTIHGRTRLQRYGGSVNYGLIGNVKKALSIPVIASGDALSPRLIAKLFSETGCDGVAIARGALGNPWIFRQTSEYLRKGTTSVMPEAEELVRTMLSHLNLCSDFYGEGVGNMIFRKFFLWYTRGIPGVKPLRQRAVLSATVAETKAIVRDLLYFRCDPAQAEKMAF